jgi:hypothetical protein
MRMQAALLDCVSGRMPSRRCRTQDLLGAEFCSRAAIHRRDLWSLLKCAAGTHRQWGSARLTRDGHGLSSFLPFSSLGRTVTVPAHGLLAPAQSSAPSAHWFYAGACVPGGKPPACSSKIWEADLDWDPVYSCLMHKSDVRLRDCPAVGVWVIFEQPPKWSSPTVTGPDCDGRRV